MVHNVDTDREDVSEEGGVPMIVKMRPLESKHSFELSAIDQTDTPVLNYIHAALDTRLDRSDLRRAI